METQFLTPLTSLESKVNALLTSITTSPSAAGAPPATAALLKADDSLTSALESLRTHQANYARILKLRAEAESLEEKIKGIVREIEGAGREISTACGDDGVGSDSDDSDSEEDRDMKGAMGAVLDGGGQKQRRGSKEVDYRLLLDFARRISRYNDQAAADAAAGSAARKLQGRDGQQKGDGDVDMTGTTTTTTVNGQPPPASEKGETGVGVASLTKDAAMWLDETANWTRDAYMIPYPNDERIRMGLMGQLQIASGDGGPDPEKEIEKLIQEAEGGAPQSGLSDTNVAPGVASGTGSNERAGGHVGSGGTSSSLATGGGEQGAVKPKAKLDLDLYDPDDDDV